jgi:putative ABC transport system permease protein
VSLNGRQPLSGGARGGAWLRGLLVGTQVALSLILLIGAALFVRAYQQMSGADPGYESRQVISVEMQRRSMGQRPSARPDFFRTLTQGLASLPGARAVAFTNLLPPYNSHMSELQLPGQSSRQARIFQISPEFFAAMGIPIVKGRALREGDLPCGVTCDINGSCSANGCSVVVSEELARQFWPDENPLGKTLRRNDHLSAPSGQMLQWGFFEVVGVARDISTQGFGQPDAPTIYMPWVPQAQPGAYFALLRFTGAASALEGAVITTTRALAPEFRVGARTIQSRIDEQLDSFQRLETLVAALGAIAVALAAIGIYGVVSFDVSRRTKEMGIRLALGGQKRDIYSAVLGGSGRPVAVGLLVGLALALAGATALARIMATAPIVMNTYDPFAFGAAILLLAAVALGAMLGPARRATRVDPAPALRDE